MMHTTCHCTFEGETGKTSAEMQEVRMPGSEDLLSEKGNVDPIPKMRICPKGADNCTTFELSLDIYL